MIRTSGQTGRPAENDRPSPQCLDEVCVTCADTAVAVTIVRLLDDDLAIVATSAGEEEISVALVRARPGDTVLVHAKEAIAVLPRSDHADRGSTDASGAHG